MTQETWCAIAVMAKAPRAGSVKSRLVPPLSVDEASALAGSFLADATANIMAAARHARIRGFVAFAPRGAEGLFEGFAAAGTDYVLADGTPPMPAGVDGLGRSLLHAAQALFDQGFGSICLVNADSPNLPTAYLTRAAEILATAGDRVVLGPTLDGGYYLIGMKVPHACLFQDVTWSTDSVAEQTRTRVRGHGIDLVELPSWYDVDDAESLERLLGELVEPRAGKSGEAERFPAPATVCCVAALGLVPRMGELAIARTRRRAVPQAG